MNKETGLPETLQESILYFAEGNNALDFVANLRWPSGVTCPCCGSKEVRFLEKRGIWECKGKHAKRQFSVKVGTIFEDSPIKLEKWLCAMWMIANCKNGVSSYEIHREIGVTQKTGWFMLQRIRLAMQTGSIEKMDGIVEVDETYIGGKARNMHKAKKEALGKDKGRFAMTPVQGLLQRGTRDAVSKIRLRVLKDTKRPEAQKAVREMVAKGSKVHTDALRSYAGLNDEFLHEVVDHAQQYVRGNVHTNGLENFWSLLKRSVRGTYVSVEPFHLFRYLDEQAWRFNARKDDNHGRFLSVVGQIFGKRLTYAKLTGKEGEQSLRPA